MDKLCIETLRKNLVEKHLLKMKENFSQNGHTFTEFESYEMGFENCLSMIKSCGDLYFLEDDEII